MDMTPTGRSGSEALIKGGTGRQRGKRGCDATLAGASACASCIAGTVSGSTGAHCARCAIHLFFPCLAGWFLLTNKRPWATGPPLGWPKISPLVQTSILFSTMRNRTYFNFNSTRAPHTHRHTQTHTDTDTDTATHAHTSKLVSFNRSRQSKEGTFMRWVPRPTDLPLFCDYGRNCTQHMPVQSNFDWTPLSP